MVEDSIGQRVLACPCKSRDGDNDVSHGWMFSTCICTYANNKADPLTRIGPATRHSCVSLNIDGIVAAQDGLGLGGLGLLDRFLDGLSCGLDRLALDGAVTVLGLVVLVNRLLNVTR